MRPLGRNYKSDARAAVPERGQSDRARREERAEHCPPDRPLAEHLANRGAGDVAGAGFDGEEAAMDGDEGLEGLCAAAADLRFVDFIEEIQV